MATAAKVVERALAQILVRQAEAPLEASEMSDAIDMMNAFFLMLDGGGLALGYTIVTSPSDEVTIPDSALMMAYTNLGLLMAPEFGAIVTPALAEMARTSMNAVRTATLPAIITTNPDTLPVGSGNECYDGRRFYPGEDAELLTENDGSILLETGTP